MSPGEKPRLFIAIEAPAPLRTAFDLVRPELVRAIPAARWCRSDALHLTVKFLGAIPVERIPSVREALERSSSDVAPFELSTGHAGVFETRGRPRVLWIELTGSVEAASRYASEVESSLEPLGFPREARPFRPHVTLARFDTGRRTVLDPDRARIIEGPLGGVSFPVHELTLYESRLGPAGARYIPRDRVVLGEGRR